MANRDDEYYDRGGRRPSQRDDRYRDDMRSSGRGRDSRPRRDYDDYDERPARRREPEGRGAGAFMGFSTGIRKENNHGGSI